MKLGERIKERRRELGLTQKELGERVQVSQKQISKYEKNDSVLFTFCCCIWFR